MRLVKNLVVVVLMMTVFLSVGCSKKSTDEIGFGTLKDNVYTNNFFGMTVKFPEDWSALDDEKRTEMMKEGMKMLAGDDKNMQAILKPSEMNSINLFMVNKHPIGSPVGFNPGISCVAEKVSHLPGITSSSDYIKSMKKIMEMSKIEYDFTKDVYSKKIGNVDFDVQEVTLNIGPHQIFQKYYATIMKGYALGIVTTASSEEEDEALGQILTNVNFH